MENSSFKLRVEHVISFIWQHILLAISLYLMTLGVALCIKSNLGSSVISSLPLSCSLAGENGVIPRFTVGEYTIGMNFLFVFLQILILRRKFNPMQLFQLVIGFAFGWLIDLNMIITQPLECDSVMTKILTQYAGCTVMAIGIAFEVRCGSVTMPGEGLPVALSRVTGMPFPKLKIIVDTILVILAVISSYMFFHRWDWSIIGPGTLFAMFYVGYAIKIINPHIDWFDRVLRFIPGFKRHIVGLARFIYRSPKQ